MTEKNLPNWYLFSRASSLAIFTDKNASHNLIPFALPSPPFSALFFEPMQFTERLAGTGGSGWG